MKKLTKTQKNVKAEIELALESAFNSLVEAIEEYNKSEDKDRTSVTQSASVYQEALSDAKIFMDSVHAEMLEYYDQRSERWQEGDAGQNYLYWAEQWDDNNLEDYVLIFDAEIEDPEDQLCIFNDLPEEP